MIVELVWVFEDCDVVAAVNSKPRFFSVVGVEDPPTLSSSSYH
jgi:hypothetical protein